MYIKLFITWVSLAVSAGIGYYNIAYNDPFVGHEKMSPISLWINEDLPEVHYDFKKTNKQKNNNSVCDDQSIESHVHIRKNL